MPNPPFKDLSAEKAITFYYVGHSHITRLANFRDGGGDDKIKGKYLRSVKG